MADDQQGVLYERGAATMKAIGNPARGPGRDRFPNLPPEQADDVQRKLIEFCFGDTWGREGSHIDLKTRRLLTIAALVSQGKERQLRGHIGGALNQGITPEEMIEAIVHLIAYRRLPVWADGAGDRQRGDRRPDVTARRGARPVGRPASGRRHRIGAAVRGAPGCRPPLRQPSEIYPTLIASRRWRRRARGARRGP